MGVSKVCRQLATTFALCALASVISGCAGLNELSDGELLTSQFLSDGGQTEASRVQFQQGSAVATQAMQSFEGGQTADTVMASSSSGSIAGTNSNTVDPINAPPPPSISTSPNQIDLQGVSQSQTTSPLMLVPPPGVSIAQQESLGAAPIVGAEEMKEVVEVPAPSVVTAREFEPSIVASTMSEPPTETVIITSEAAQPAMRGREFVPAPISFSGPASSSLRPGEIPLTQEQLNVRRRFEIFNDLLAMGLVTRQEYMLRRSQNIGAILAYTNETPAIGLQRAVPSGEAISARLSALKRSLEMRAITPRQHGLERSMILDALLPSNPRTRATPVPPPSDVIAAAALIGQLERLRFESVISDEEFESERLAIDQFIQMGTLALGSDSAQGLNTAEEEGEDAFVAPVAATGLGVHLASYRSQAAAQDGWSSLNRKFQGELQGLLPVIRRVNLGEPRGVFYRLYAGPVASSSQANSICQQLKQASQYCDPLRYDG